MNDTAQETIEFTILGSPKAQGRPRAARRGKFVTVYDPPESRKAKQNVAVVAQQYAPDELLTGPLSVDMRFYFSRPNSHYGTGRNAGKLKDSAPGCHTKKPDIDNLRKLFMDALTGIIFKDDSQVCRGTTSKSYSEKPRTEIFIKTLDKLQ